MSIFSKIFGKKKKNPGYLKIVPGPDKGGHNDTPSTPKPKIKVPGQKIKKKLIENEFDEEDIEILRKLIDKYEYKRTIKN